MVDHVWVGLQDVLVEPSVNLSRDTLAEGGSIPCHVGNPISNKRHAVFDFILCMWSVRCKRSARFYLLVVDTIIILLDLILKKILVIVR